VETRSLVEGHDEYALQPWRALIGSRVTYAAIARSDGQALGVEVLPYGAGAMPLLAHVLGQARGQHVAAWNAVFDVSWCLAYGLDADVLAIRWWDAKLMWKWVDPNRYSYHLIDAAEEILLKKLSLPWVPRYIALKREERERGFNTENTGDYNKLDSYATAILAEYFWERLTEQQRRSVAIEASLIVPVANSWVRGVPLDLDHAANLKPKLEETKRRIELELGLTDEVLSSPKQLSRVLYQEWKLPVLWRTEKEEPSTDKTALTYLTDHDRRAGLILDWREANTRLNKFVEGSFECANYIGAPVSHAQPQIFSTYTGRMTYESRQLKQHPVGIALHQVPRDKDYRKLVVPPPGFLLFEDDFAGQEMRLMADIGEEDVLRQLFREKKDPHSYTGAGILRVPYEEFMQRYKAGEEAIAGPKGGRYLGKFTNLSLQYRTSAKTLRRKARVDYGVDADYETAKLWHATYHRLYPGVKRYWRRAIHAARTRGYAETMAGRRYYLPERAFLNDEWQAESTAINHPIQGTGADQKELGLAIVTAKFPEVTFAFDLHDGLYFWVQADLPGLQELLREIKRTLSHLPYSDAWGWAPAVPYPVDAKVGAAWGRMEEIQ